MHFWMYVGEKIINIFRKVSYVKSNVEFSQIICMAKILTAIEFHWWHWVFAKKKITTTLILVEKCGAFWCRELSKKINCISFGVQGSSESDLTFNICM